MAGNWIKIENVTPDKPEVWGIAEYLDISPDAVVGKLVRIWVWADQQTYDGNAGSVTKALLDRIAGIDKFADAMFSVGWLAQARQGLIFPNFGRHNGQTAKQRALTSKRVEKHRADVTPPALHERYTSVTKALPEKNRIEKNREEVREYSEEELDKSNSPSSYSGDLVSKKGGNRKRKPYSPKFEEFWQTCPPRKRGGKKAASEAYARAVDRLRGIQDDPHAFLLARFSAYWESPLGQTQYANGPAPWLNQGHYDDDPAAWERDDGEDISGLVLQFDN